MDRDQIQKLSSMSCRKQDFIVSMKDQVFKWKEGGKVTGISVTEIEHRDKAFFGDAQIPTELVPLNRKGMIDIEGPRRLEKIRPLKVAYTGVGTWTEVD